MNPAAHGDCRQISDPLADHSFCRELLPKVSRTFAACIHLLPTDVEYPVLLAYLLCRIADTCEDTADLAVETKEHLLTTFATCLDEDGGDASALATAFANPRTDDECLTRDADRVLREFRRLPEAQRTAIRPWIQDMCRGMANFARKHAAARPDHIEALDSLDDLDRYCYYVAGTVGHLLTELFRLNQPRMSSAQYEQLRSLATSFGLGLQLTNIIKDVADDRRRGWMFVPRELCTQAGITPERFLDPADSTAAQNVMHQLITKAAGHLDDALNYCTALPRSAYRLRLFCLTPLYFAVRTLALARSNPRLLDPAHKVKITRREVYRTISMTYLIAPNNFLVRRYYHRLSAAPR